MFSYLFLKSIFGRKEGMVDQLSGINEKGDICPFLMSEFYTHELNTFELLFCWFFECCC